MILGYFKAGMPCKLSPQALPFERESPDTGEKETIHGIVVDGTLHLSAWAWEELLKCDGVEHKDEAS